MLTPRRQLRLLLAALCFSFAQPFAAVAQTNSAPLPPAAQEALDKGIIAARVPDYLLAIRYFEEARKLAPQAPVVYLNMGLAESKIPGRELRAMAWFGAYLSAFPDAPNAAAVKEQINVLDVRNQGNVSRLIKAMQDAANQMPGNNIKDMWSGRGNKHASLRVVAVLQAQAGDITAALNIADLIQDAPYRRSAQSTIAVAQAKSGDAEGAKKTFAKALKTADLNKDAGEKSFAYCQVAEDQIEAGDIAGAKITLIFAITNIGSSDIERFALARAQARSGDTSGAKKTVDLIQDVDQKREAQRTIDVAQAKATEFNAKNSTSQSTSVLALLPLAKVSDWLFKLDDDSKSSDCPLNSGLFLNLAGHLKSLPPSNDPVVFFESVRSIAEKTVAAQNVIQSMLKQQTIR